MAAQSTEPVKYPPKPPVSLEEFLARAHAAGCLPFLNNTNIAGSYEIRKVTVIEKSAAEAARPVPVIEPMPVPSAPGRGDGDPMLAELRHIGNALGDIRISFEMFLMNRRSALEPAHGGNVQPSAAATVPVESRDRSVFVKPAGFAILGVALLASSWVAPFLFFGFWLYVMGFAALLMLLGLGWLVLTLARFRRGDSRASRTASGSEPEVRESFTS